MNQPGLINQASVAVIGSGFAGLTAAHRLKKAGLRPVVFEALDRPGGRTWSVQRGEFLFDLGTIALLGGNPITHELVEAAGLGPYYEMAPPMVVGIVRDGVARRIDSAHPLRDFIRTDLFSTGSKLRLAKLGRDIYRLKDILTNDNAIGLGRLDRMTIPEYGLEQFNQEILDYLFSPIVRGIWATSAKGHSVVQLLWTLRQMAYPLYSLSTGNGSLTTAIARQHEMRYGHVVEHVEERGHGVQVEYSANGVRCSEHFAACVIATPVPTTRKIFPAMAGAQQRFFEQIRFTSILCVHVALSKRPSNTETALMFPEREFDDVAVVYVNHNKAPGRAPAGKGSVSVYFTQEWSADKMDWPDQKIIDVALERLSLHYGNLRGNPGGSLGDQLAPLVEDAFVQRWPTFIMDATPGLYKLMDEYHQSLVNNPPARIQLAGDFMPNAGINQAMASGAAAAQRIVAALTNTSSPANPTERQSMKTLLRIDSSSRIDGSHSRELADVIEKRWRAKNPDGRVVVRDLSRTPVPHIENDTIGGFYSDPSGYSEETQKAMVLSDTLVKELLDADEVLLSVPIYNFSMPSVLKAWVDQIVRPGWTFNYSDDGTVTGLVQGKRAYVALAYGLQYAGTELAAYDYLKPLLETTLGYIGLTDVQFVAVEGTALGDPEKLAQHKAEVYAKAGALV